MIQVPWHEGDVIRKLRTIYRFTLPQMEKHSKVRMSTISRIELGKTRDPKRDTLDKIAKVFNMDWRQVQEAVPAGLLTVDSVSIEARRLARRMHARGAGRPHPILKARRDRK